MSSIINKDMNSIINKDVLTRSDILRVKKYINNLTVDELQKVYDIFLDRLLYDGTNNFDIISQIINIIQNRLPSNNSLNTTSDTKNKLPTIPEANVLPNNYRRTLSNQNRSTSKGTHSKGTPSKGTPSKGTPSKGTPSRGHNLKPVSGIKTSMGGKRQTRRKGATKY
jgi:hypothetical protein